jgi:hypothetical protein
MAATDSTSAQDAPERPATPYTLAADESKSRTITPARVHLRTERAEAPLAVTPRRRDIAPSLEPAVAPRRPARALTLAVFRPSKRAARERPLANTSTLRHLPSVNMPT